MISILLSSLTSPKQLENEILPRRKNRIINDKKEFTINRFFEASGSSLKSAHSEDKLYNMTRKSVLKLLNPFKKLHLKSIIKVKKEFME